MTKFSSFKEQQKLFENWRRHTNESYRAAYDAGHLRSDDERRSDNKSLQQAADEYADKMHDAWTASIAGSEEEKYYEKEYRKHSENANRESPLPIHQLEEQNRPDEEDDEEDDDVDMVDIDGEPHRYWNSKYEYQDWKASKEKKNDKI